MGTLDSQSCPRSCVEADCWVQPTEPSLVNSLLTHALWAVVLHNVPFAPMAEPLVDGASDPGVFDV